MVSNIRDFEYDSLVAILFVAIYNWNLAKLLFLIFFLSAFKFMVLEISRFSGTRKTMTIHKMVTLVYFPVISNHRKTTKVVGKYIGPRIY
jgi:hypothetical protein